MDVIVFCRIGFKDGTILPKGLKPFEKITVSEQLFERMKQSAPDAEWEIVGRVVPKSTRSSDKVAENG